MSGAASLAQAAVARRPALIRHPDSQADFVRRFEAGAARLHDLLVLSFRLEAQPGALRIPAEVPPSRGEQLWQHTCFEAFARAKGAEEYFEFNFSPSRAWAAYRFHRYRQRAQPDPVDPISQLDVARDGAQLELDAALTLARLPTLRHGPLELGLSAVLESAGGHLSYWALKHPAGRPDFHHADSFVLRLE